jgi:hypothetical protein
MGMRYEWTGAADTGFYAVSVGAEMGGHLVAPGNIALVLGGVGGTDAYVIEGTRLQVALLLGRSLLTVLQHDADAEREMWAELDREPPA